MPTCFITNLGETRGFVKILNRPLGPDVFIFTINMVDQKLQCYICDRYDKDEDMRVCSICDNIICESCNHECSICDRSVCESCEPDYISCDCDDKICDICETRIQDTLDGELFLACSKNDMDAVLVALSDGANASADIGDGWRCLGAAILKGNLPIIKVLLEHGASVKNPCCDGYTPYILAALSRRWDICQELFNFCSTKGIDLVSESCH